MAVIINRKVCQTVRRKPCADSLRRRLCCSDGIEGKIVDEALPIGTVITISAAGSEGSLDFVITKEDGMFKTRCMTVRTEQVLL